LDLYEYKNLISRASSKVDFAGVKVLTIP